MENELYNTTASSDPASAGLFLFGMFFVIGLILLALVPMWKTFTKAGRPGWAAIVPIYNIYMMVKIAGRPGWWTLLYFVPLVNIVVPIIVAIDTAKAFNRSSTFGVVGLWLFSLIGYCILAFGDDVYTDPTLVATPMSTEPTQQPGPPAQPTI